MIRLGTVFSGIGAIEHALERLNIKHSIEFACDNGERNLKTSEYLVKYSNYLIEMTKVKVHMK